jgi:phospholipid-transporting ATPase
MSAEFSRSANLFFLFTACIQQVPGVSPTGRYTTIVPLAVVIIASAFKEIQEDFKRHASDKSLNNNRTQVLADQGFDERPWRRIRVGDIVRLDANDFIPADMVLLSSSEPEGLCYVETANLDGWVTEVA